MNKLDWNFITESLKALLPIVLVFSWFYVSGHLSSDYYVHLSYMGYGDYPPFLSWLLAAAGQYRDLGLFLLNIAFTTVIPFALIYRITKSFTAGWAYTYSGIPLILFTVWLVPQSIIHVLMLLAIINPLGLVLFALIGVYIHSFYLAGLGLSFAYLWYRLCTTGRMYD